MSEFKMEKIKVAIKATLKNQKKTYDQLAEHLGCSVATVKRMLGKESLSSERLLMILDYVGLSLGEIDELANRVDKSSFVYSEEQQKFLVEHPGHFVFLMNLRSSKTVDEIKQIHELTEKTVTRILIDLENLELIKYDSKNAPQPVHEEMGSLGYGPLGKFFHRRAIEGVMNFYLDEISDAFDRPEEVDKDIPMGLTGRAFQVTEETYKDYMEKVNDLLEQLLEKAEFEGKTMPKDNLRAAVVTVASILTDKENQRIANLTLKNWGEIENI
jgi:predicted transcriptional regulator